MRSHVAVFVYIAWHSTSVRPNLRTISGHKDGTAVCDKPHRMIGEDILANICTAKFVCMPI
jgi:hypothetical protein